VSDVRTLCDSTGAPATISAAGAERRSTQEPPRAGDRIGRYVLLEPLGSGGMGFVYAAYDPELDRKVAVKLLHDFPTGGMSSGGGRNRLLEEARALASLSHPNVIAVHDVGLHDGRVFVAMEFVDGQTLRQWLSREKPSPAEILRAFSEAGAGLWAAHRAGLAHRDFKPDNVMIDTEGRIKVLDFGLARSLENQSDASTPGSLLVDGPNTVGLVGTPAYMAPEQFAGLRGDARSDQFSFCVALYEALFRHRPFKGRTFAELAASTLADDVTMPATVDGVSPGIREALERGLAKEAEQRFASMQELLAELAPPESKPPRPWWRLAASAAIGGALVAAAVLWWPEPPQPCVGAEESVAEAWDASRRDVLRRAVGGDDETTVRVVEQVGDALDVYAARVARQVRIACEAHARQAMTEDEYGRRRQCLDRRRHALAHVVDFFIATPQSVLERGPEVVAMLPMVGGCDDPSKLGDLADIDDPQRLAQAYALERGLDEIRTLVFGGERERAGPALEEILAEAREHRFRGIEARALHQRGLFRMATGDPSGAVEVFRRAFPLALRSGYYEVAIDCGSGLAHHFGYREGDLDEGAFWLDVSRALVDRHGAAPDSLVKLKIEEGTQTHSRGKLEPALASYEEAVALCNEHFANLPSRCTEALMNQAETLRDLARHDEAIEVYERVLTTLIERHGERHPRLSTILTNYAVTLRGSGQLEDALARGREAVAIGEAHFGPDNFEVVPLLGNVADTLTRLGRVDEATEILDRILAMTKAQLGDDHLMMSYARDSRGHVALARGDWTSARADFEHAIRIRTGLYGEVHPTLVSPERGLAEALLGLGDPQRSRRHYERVVDMCATLGCEGEAIVARAGLVEAALVLGRPHEAITALDAARQALDASQQTTAYARARVALAQALVSTHDDELAAAREALVAAVGESDSAVLRLDATP
jgi:eukaryotic-like serine/threonine-protein kinase